MYYGTGYGVDTMYIIVIVVSLLLGLITQNYIKRTYAKWSKVDASFRGTGADVARRMLDEGGASSVGITRVAGTLTDYYDPRDNDVHLSDENYARGSVASVAVACHEAGHAVQTARGFAPIKIRTALVPVVNFASNAWFIILIIGTSMSYMGLVRFAIILYAATVIFQLVTLPVEIDASRRAVAFLGAQGSAIDQEGAKQVLTAAALTYVAAALASLLQLVYLLMRTERD